MAFDPSRHCKRSKRTSGRATVIVTGDGDMLALGEFEVSVIVKPRTHLDSIED